MPAGNPGILFLSQVGLKQQDSYNPARTRHSASVMPMVRASITALLGSGLCFPGLLHTRELFCVDV